MADALLRAGLEQRALFPKGLRVWCLAGDEVVRFFQPAPYRRGWGYVYTGYVGIELPSLRKWLASHDLGRGTIFHHSFIAHNTLNDDDRKQFMIDLEDAFPADQLAVILREKLARLPSTVEQLVSAYQDHPTSLGGLAGPIHRNAWEFLQHCVKSPDDCLSIPRRGPDGLVVE